MCNDRDSLDTYGDCDSLETVRGEVAVRLAVEPAAAMLGVCCPGLLYSCALAVTNKGRVAVALAAEPPADLRKHVRVKPAALRLRAGERRRLQLQLCARRSFSRDAQKYTCQLSGVTQFPVEIVPISNSASAHPKLTVQVLVAVSPPQLEVTPALVDLGSVVTCEEAVTAHIQLSNRSLMKQTYGFLGVSEELSVEPGGGFGDLQPGEVADLMLVFSPLGGEGPRRVELRVDTTLGAAASRFGSRPLSKRRLRGGGKVAAASTYACSVRITADVISPRLQISAHRVSFPLTPVGSHSTTEFTMTCLASEARFSFKTPDDQLQVIPPAGSLLLGHRLRVVLLYLPRASALASGGTDADPDAKTEAQMRVICEAETTVDEGAEWRRESLPVLALCRAAPASLTPVSQAVGFGAVAAGCTACRVVCWLNASASWLRVRPALSAQAHSGDGGGDGQQEAFRWPTLPVLLPPGHELHLPVTFTPLSAPGAALEVRRCPQL
ncbi:cilia- and flagella-associated protein 74-like [Frankliniella occidentalis]|uniref:Cilia- and flagella-associated protein 74-like n=1 Tax=Frankliniella occidentalis TaxID=133901 RepID=A0A9C6WY78_FRAOC|nr:cilia- and flagella-associated protein 74-like [Frankliniella occidentalis]